MSESNESLQRAEELLERLRGQARRARALPPESGDVDRAVDDLAAIAEIAKEIEAEIQRARRAADAGA